MRRLLSCVIVLAACRGSSEPRETHEIAAAPVKPAASAAAASATGGVPGEPVRAGGTSEPQPLPVVDCPVAVELRGRIVPLW